MRLIVLICLFLCLCSGAGAETTQKIKTANTVILISMDGFRPDYLDRGHTPMLKQLADEGARAQWMTPSYPSLTFPNHYTLVTGLRPDHHGIVHNTMLDPELGGFALKNRDAIADGRWWGGEPIWVTTQKQGLRSATMFWPGSEAKIAGKRPNYWQVYDKKFAAYARVDKVLSWLDLPIDQRPQFITLYFEDTDDAGHRFGIDSEELAAALQKNDAAITQLVHGLEQRGLRDSTTIVVTSDHGMIETPPSKLVLLDDVIPIDTIDVITQGQAIGIAAKLGRKKSVEAALLGQHEHFSCWRRNELPAIWRYGKHARVPPIVCQADEGWTILTKEKYIAGKNKFSHSEHGFDPNLVGMRALFIANGRNIKPNTLLAPINNVDVYPFLCALLNIKPKKNDGDAQALKAALIEK
jgi:predicted AlkP superfamily pyrophosphatase or phosphodiesterase